MAKKRGASDGLADLRPAHWLDLQEGPVSCTPRGVTNQFAFWPSWEIYLATWAAMRTPDKLDWHAEQVRLAIEEIGLDAWELAMSGPDRRSSIEMVEARAPGVPHIARIDP